MLRLKTLGGWQSESANGVAVTLPSQRVSLLAVLIAAGDRGISRDRVAALLWPDRSEENARHSLGQSLYALRRDAGSPDVVLGTATLRLNRDVVWCDAWELETAAASDDLTRAVELYAGPFLDGVHVRGSAELEHLVDVERDRIARLHSRALESLAARTTSAGDLVAAAAWWRRLATIDPLSSRIALELVRALAQSGDRAAALQAARVHETLVREELNARPDPTFVALVDALRHEVTVPVESPAIVAPAPTLATDLARTADPMAAERDAIDHSAPPAAVSTRPDGRRRSLPRSLAWGSIAATILVAWSLAFRERPQSVAALDPERVYVAWFDNRTGDPALAQVGGMASDWITQGLEQSGLVAVASAARAEDATRAATRDRAPNDASSTAGDAARLGAGLLVSGAVYRLGDQLRFHVQVSDVARGEILDAFDASGGTPSNPSVPLDAVRQRTIGSLASFIDPRLRSWAQVASRPPSYEAYREFVTGQAIWGTAHRQALGHFLRAASLDSTFHAARVEAATLYRLLGECDRTEAIARDLENVRTKLPPYEYHALDVQVAQCQGDWQRSYREARALSDLKPRSAFLEYSLALQAMQLGRFREAKALLDHHALEQGVAEVGPNYALVYTQLAWIAGDRTRALDVAEWARARYPTYARVWGLESTLLARDGRFEETARFIDTMTALPLEPRSAIVGALRRTANSLAFLGDSTGAANTRARALALLDATDRASGGSTRSERAQLLYESGRLDEAQRLFAQLVANDSSDVDARAHLGLIAASRGDTTTANAIDGWLASTRPPYVLTRTLYRARIAAVRESHEQALELLGAALDESGRFLTLSIRELPEFSCIRQDDRFQRLLRVSPSD